MKTLYLHIGTPKTGTSAVQLFLEVNRETLKKKGYCFLPTESSYKDKANYRRNAHFLISSGCSTDPKKERARKKEIDEGLQVVADWFKTYDNVILTDEGIWNYLRDKNWVLLEQLTDFCKNKDVILKLIVYLRRQDEYMLSWWRQRIRAGYDFGEWEDFAEKPPQVLVLDYFAHLKKIEQYVQKENLIVRRYEKKEFRGAKHTVYSDFLEAIGLEDTDEYIVRKEIVYESMTDDYAYIKSKLNKLQGENKIRKSDVSLLFEKPAIRCSKLSDFNEKYTLLTKEQSERILQRYADSNDKVLKEYFPELAYLFSDDFPDKKKWMRERTEMLESIILYFGELFLEQRTEINQLKTMIAETESMVKEYKTAMQAVEILTVTPKRLWKGNKQKIRKEREI